MNTLPLYILIIIVSVTSSAEIAVQGIEGESCLINWTYPRGYESYAKYFHRGKCSFSKKVKLIESNEGNGDQNVTKGNYSLYDYKSAALLTITITKVSLDDIGNYCFGIKKTGFDTTISVHVSLTKAPTIVDPLSTLTTCTDNERQSYTTSSIDGRPETELTTSSTRDANNTTSTDVTSHSVSVNISQSSQAPNDNGRADTHVIGITVSAIALVFVLSLIIGIYYAKIKNKKALSSKGGRTKTMKNTSNGDAQVSEQNIDMVSYSDISFTEINNPIYGNSEEAANYSTENCHKKEQRPSTTYTTLKCDKEEQMPSITYATVKCDKEEQRPSTTYATVKCDKEEQRPSITYTAVDFVDCEKKPNVLASASETPSLYSTVNC